MIRFTRAAIGSVLVAALFLTGCAMQPEAAPVTVPTAVSPVTSTVAPEVAPLAEPKLVMGTPLPMRFSPVLNPATFGDLYEIVDRAAGYPADDSAPRYLLAHTRTAGFGAPGNTIIDSNLAPGDVIEVEGARYTVDAVTEVLKPAIGGLDIWQATDPDALFIIVCAWNSGNSAVANLIVSATRVATNTEEVH